MPLAQLSSKWSHQAGGRHSRSRSVPLFGRASTGTRLMVDRRRRSASCGRDQQRYIEAQRQLVDVALPSMRLWSEIEQYTSGDGHLDKLCVELVGLPSGRCRPPTRDIRHMYRDKARAMFEAVGASLPALRK